jgi:signal transduction histidine kinase
MTHAPPRGIRIKTVVLLAFALLVALWALSSFNLTRRIANTEGGASDISGRYTHAQDLLSDVRTQVLLGSVYVRDALMDPDLKSTPTYRQQVGKACQAAQQAMHEYVPVLGTPDERARVARLGREVMDFCATLQDVLATDSNTWPVEARLLLSQRISPRRNAAIRISEEVQTLNRHNFVQQQAELAAFYRTTQTQVLSRFAIALVASLGIAVVAIVYAGRLESRLRRQSARDLDNAEILQRLSAKLISAQEEERRSIARELHDEIGQALTAIKVELAVADQVITSAGGPAHALEDVRSITDGTLQTVRDLSHHLHPALLDDLGLRAAVDSYLRSVSKRHGIRVDLLHDRMDERLTAETEAAAYRIIQEALTNVVRHAHATTCRVYLQRLVNTVLVTIEDDGVGFVAPSGSDGRSAQSGLGLIGIRERVSQLQGTLRLESTFGEGTRITIELPARLRETGPDADDPESPGAVAGIVEAGKAHV